MKCTNRTEKKILGYSAIFKKMGILKEEQYKQIMTSFQERNRI